MKRFAITALFITTFVFLLPMMAVRGTPLVRKDELPEYRPENAIEAAGSAEVVRIGEEERDTAISGSDVKDAAGAAIKDGESDVPSDPEVRVRLKDGEEVITLSLYDYLLGVVSAEMPASFPAEALKAQAVAARTFTYSRMLLAEKGKPAHTGADVCSDSSHCKAYMPWEEIRGKWETLGKDEYIEKVENAVRETDGELIYYEEEPIVAVFHAAAGTYTEDAKDVWGGEVPYLKSVKSPDGAEYQKSASFGTDEFRQAFVEKHPDAVFGGRPSDWIGETVRSDAGGVISVVIGGVRVSGRDVRSIFGLPSANFEIEAGKDRIVFRTSGFGHCVGMSQYGARALALKGKDYREILEWYYTGVEIKRTGVR